MDVEVLSKGYNNFRTMILNRFEIDLINYLSNSSLADEIFKKYGVYNDIYELTGHTRAFIQNAIVGGRVMTNSNKKHLIDIEIKDGKYIKDFITDFERSKLISFRYG